MKRKGIIIALIIAAVLLLGTAIGTLAYFTWHRTSEPGLTITPDGNVVTVSTFEELFRASQASAYNDGAAVAPATSASRITLRFAADILMETDLTVTADVNLDLDGHDLLTGGHTLSFRHTYHGAFVMAGGRVILSSDGAGAVTAETPNAAILFDGMAVGTLSDDGTFTAADADTYLRIITASPAYLAYHFFGMVASAVADDVTLPTSPAGAPEDAPTAFTASLYWRVAKATCPTHGTAPCAYLFGDADLPRHYLGYAGATVSYATAAGVLDPSGRLTGTGDETLTATLTVDGTAYTCSFDLHAPDISTAAAQATVAADMVARYLGRFYVGTVTDGDETVTVNKYVLNRDIYLPARFAALPLVKVSYAGYTVEGSSTFPRENQSTAPTEDTVLFIPTTDTGILEVTVTSLTGTSLGTDRYTMTSDNTVTVRSAVTVANDLLKKWYGAEISVSANGDGSYAYSGPDSADAFSGYLPLYGMAYYNTYNGGAYAAAYPGVESIRYSVVYGNTAAEYYAITDEGDPLWQRLSVATGKPEEDAGRVYLNIELRVTYGGTTSDVTLQIPIDCRLRGGGTGLSRFLPYYSVLNRTVADETGGYTLSSFYLPFNFQRDLPVYCYAFTVDGADTAAMETLRSILGLTLVDADGNETALKGVIETVTVTDDDGTSSTYPILSFAASLTGTLTSESAWRTNALSGKARYRITLDTAAIPATNTQVRLVYQYKMAYAADGFTTYDSFSDFTIPGVLHYGAEIADENFFIWLYNSFRTSGNAITGADGALIRTDWLTRNVSLDFPNSGDTYLRAVTDFTGIRYMTGTQYVDLTGATVSEGVIREIASMRSLLTLNLTSCGIVLTTTDENPFEAWYADGSALSNLTTLRLGGNRIYSFVWLETFCTEVATSLTDLYLSGNVPVPGVTASADNVFYGSAGLSNYDTYQALQNAGIRVYSGGGTDTPALFADSRSSSQVYLALRNLEYQNTLPAGVEIENVYGDLSVSPADYGISATGITNGDYNCTLTGVTLAFARVSDTVFSLTYTATASGGGRYQMVLRFTVTYL